MAASRKIAIAAAGEPNLVMDQSLVPQVDPLHPKGFFPADLVTAYAPFTRQAEAFRAVCTQLAQRWLDGQSEGKAVAIVSSGRAEGRSSMAANLGVAFSQSGKRTLVVDADLRTPRQHRLFNVENQAGLATLLCGWTPRLKPLQSIAGLPKLSVLVAGPTPPDAADLLSRPVFGDLCAEFTEAFDVVIFDTAPAAMAADAQIVASCAGTALLVARRHATRTSSLQELAANLVSARAAGTSGRSE